MGENSTKLKIFGDLPTTDDGLGFDHYVDILFSLIENFEATSPLTIGIHGSWGSGKTSLMRMLEKKLTDGENSNIKTIWFNAWAYGGDEPIGLALLQRILIAFQEEAKNGDKIESLGRSIGRLLIDAGLRKIAGIRLEEAGEHFKSTIDVKGTLRDDFESVIGESLGDRRLVLFIDDLDRCLPEKTIEILEVIKLFLDLPKCMYIIGVEKDVIERGIEVRYRSKEQEIPISGKDYIEKIIQLPFTLPPIREEDMTEFIEKLGIGEKEKSYGKIVAKGTNCNPRKVKLFLNTLRIREAIAERTGGKIEPDLAAKLFVFECVFPQFYRDLMKYRDQKLLCKLERLAKKEADDELMKELERSETLQKHHKNRDLNSLLKDEPYLCGIDLEPYIYLSGTGEPEATVSDEALLNELLNELLSEDLMKVIHAANLIKKIPDSEKQQYLNVIVPKLKDANKNVRESAALALGYIGDARAVEPLIEALKDQNEYVRLGAALALRNIGDTRAVEPLMEALKDESENVRSGAAWALEKIGDTRAVEPLMEVLKDESENVRWGAADALRKIRSKKQN